MRSNGILIIHGQSFRSDFAVTTEESINALVWMAVISLCAAGGPSVRNLSSWLKPLGWLIRLIIAQLAWLRAATYVLVFCLFFVIAKVLCPLVVAQLDAGRLRNLNQSSALDMADATLRLFEALAC